MEEEEQEIVVDKNAEKKELIKQANEAAERLEIATKKHAELMEEEAKRQLEKTFDGKSSAGEGKTIISDADYAEKVLANDAGAEK